MKLIKLEKNRCANCMKLTNYLEHGVQVQPDEVYNIENKPEIAAKYRVMAAPVLILEDDKGNEVDRVLGFSEGREAEVDELIQRYREGA